MTATDWVEATGIPMPTCKMQGCCCRGASPSTPAKKLLEKAADGDVFARNFFNIFIPYPNHDAARQVVPGLVERTLKASEKDAGFDSHDDVVFYHCRYIGEDNKCQIWEDRPELCRAYPDSPFVVFAPNCAFEPWAMAARQKFAEMKASIEELKTLKDSLHELKQESTNYTKIDALVREDDNLLSLNLVLPLLPLYLASPLGSYFPTTSIRLSTRSMPV